MAVTPEPRGQAEAVRVFGTRLPELAFSVLPLLASLLFTRVVAQVAQQRLRVLEKKVQIRSGCHSAGGGCWFWKR